MEESLKKMRMIEAIFKVMWSNLYEAMKYAHDMHRTGNAENECARLYKTMANGHMSFNETAETILKNLMHEIESAGMINGEILHLFTETYKTRLENIHERQREVVEMLEWK